LVDWPVIATRAWTLAYHKGTTGGIDAVHRQVDAPPRLGLAAHLLGLPGLAHGRDVRDQITSYFAGFGGRYLRLVPVYIADHKGVEHLEIPAPPTMTKPLTALRFIVLKPDWFADSGTFLWDT
jgi:hypothetical protein